MDNFSSNGENSFTTSRGVKIHFLGIATLIEALRESQEAKKPKPPTYEVKTLGGAVEQHIHDETTLETEADKTNWAAYQQQLRAWEKQSEKDLMRLLMLRGIDLKFPDDTRWEQEHKFVGLDVPTDPLEKRMHYIETEVLGGVADYEALMLGVMRISGVTEEKLSQVEASFRGLLGQHTAETASNQSGKLESQPKI